MGAGSRFESEVTGDAVSQNCPDFDSIALPLEEDSLASCASTAFHQIADSVFATDSAVGKTETVRDRCQIPITEQSHATLTHE
jgi:hypothetical protein